MYVLKMYLKVCLRSGTVAHTPLTLALRRQRQVDPYEAPAWSTYLILGEPKIERKTFSLNKKKPVCLYENLYREAQSKTENKPTTNSAVKEACPLLWCKYG